MHCTLLLFAQCDQTDVMRIPTYRYAHAQAEARQLVREFVEEWTHLRQEPVTPKGFAAQRATFRRQHPEFIATDTTYADYLRNWQKDRQQRLRSLQTRYLDSSASSGVDFPFGDKKDKLNPKTCFELIGTRFKKLELSHFSATPCTPYQPTPTEVLVDLPLYLKWHTLLPDGTPKRCMTHLTFTLVFQLRPDNLLTNPKIRTWTRDTATGRLPTCPVRDEPPVLRQEDLQRLYVVIEDKIGHPDKRLETLTFQARHQSWYSVKKTTGKDRFFLLFDTVPSVASRVFVEGETAQQEVLLAQTAEVACEHGRKVIRLQAPPFYSRKVYLRTNRKADGKREQWTYRVRADKQEKAVRSNQRQVLLAFDRPVSSKTELKGSIEVHGHKIPFYAPIYQENGTLYADVFIKSAP